jgi:Tol biopolymer transport system component
MKNYPEKRSSANILLHLVLGSILGVILALLLFQLPGMQSSLSQIGLLFQSERVTVLEFSPRAGSNAGVFTTVEIQFSEEMDSRSVEAVFQIQPDVDGVFRWEGVALQFVPLSPLEPGDYRVSIGAGASALREFQFGADQSWQFTIREPRVSLLAPASGEQELWLINVVGETDDHNPITATQGKIVDYDLAPDGRIIVSIRNSMDGADLWLLEDENADAVLIAECGIDRCAEMDWTPDGERVAYSREEGGPEAAAFRRSRIWTIAPENGEGGPLFQNAEQLGREPSWSPDGHRLAFYDPVEAGIRILDLQHGDEELIPSPAGIMGDWSPDGAEMLFAVPDFSLSPARTMIYQINLETKEVRPVLGDEVYFSDVVVPAYSPDGRSILVAAQSPEQGLGRQLWLISLIGESSIALTDDPDFTYGAVQWGPWGKQILAQRFDFQSQDALPEIVLLSLDNHELRMLHADAWLPDWLP